MAFKDVITINTRRLVLRAAEQEDAVPLHQIMEDPEVMRYWSELPHADLARTEDWVSSMVRSSQNGVTDFMICLTDDEDRESAALSWSENRRMHVIGKVGIFRARPSNEIGFVLDRCHWGKGLAKEALTTLLAYLFSFKRASENATSQEETTDLDPHVNLSSKEMQSAWSYPSITADVEPRNAASIGLLEKLGFVESGLMEKTFKLGDEWQDTLYLRLTREKWVGACE